MIKNDLFLKKTWFFLSLFKICIGLLFVNYPALIQEYLYPHCVLLGGEIGLIQMGWIHISIGFWSGTLLYVFPASLPYLLSLGLLWSLTLFKDLWSLWSLVSWQNGWGWLWHLVHVGICLGVWIQIQYCRDKT
jgi:hypothetical protein